MSTGIVPIRDMFEALVPEYDSFNRCSSFGLDIRWRKQVASFFKAGDHVLDVGTGTGDLARSLLNQSCAVTGVDFSEKMIQAARHKLKKRSNAAFYVAGADNLPFKDGTFDGLTSGFVVRNLHRGKVLSPSLREFNRVLRSGGKMVHLELTRPPRGLMRRGHDLYLRFVLPAIGKALFGHRWPNDYLQRTIQGFLSPEELCQVIRWAGFDQISHYPVCGGIAGMFVATKC